MMAATTNTPDTMGLIPSKYTSTFDDISMQGDRAQRFMQTFLDVWDIYESLRTASASFPNVLTTPGEMAPRQTVEAFALLLRSRLNVLHSLAIGEDHIDCPNLHAWERPL